MLARGLPIVQEKWIIDSKSAGRFLGKFFLEIYKHNYQDEF
jgi:hypothetical protein